MNNSAVSFSSKKFPKVIRENLQVILIGFVLVILLIGTFVAVQLSQIQQENRQKASVSTGVVVVNTTAPSTIQAGQPSVLTFTINTNNAPIDGVQLHFQLDGVSTDPAQAPVMQSAAGTPLVFFSQINATGTGYDIILSGLNPLNNPPPPSFNSNGATVELVKLAFTASNTAPAVNVTYTQDDSFTIVNGAPGQDDLNPVSNASFPITQQVVPTETPIVQVTDTIAPSPTLIAQVTDTLVPTPTDTLVPTPTDVIGAPTATPLPTSTPLPTATPDNSGLGGTTIKYCGESCTAHSDCAVNLLCYSGVCRLANNPTDTSCNNPPDNGIHRVCNEYCADSRECQTGLTCYYNSCRNPRNVNDKYCSEPIANNTTTKIVTKNVVVTATPKPATPTEIPNSADLFPAQSESTQTDYLPTDTPWPTYAPVSEVTPEPESDQITMVQRIQSWLKGLLIVAVVISAVFFLLWLLPLFLKRRHDDDDQPPMPMTGSGSDNSSDHSDYSDSLKDKTSGGGLA